ncbi:MAG: thiamine pyrophosphate-binding protein [Rhodopseudomonas palustris]|nr:thiamine pyrophosphate-binding protein [Rhodopseudomonas palustris]
MAPRASDALLDILRDEGITHIFGNPGSTGMPLMDALVDATDITYVLGLQEATAVGMADGWALSSGKVGFVNLYASGGLGNAMGVLVALMASETPVVTAGYDTRHLMTEPWPSGDLVALAAQLHQWAGEVRRRRRRQRAAPCLCDRAHPALWSAADAADGRARPAGRAGAARLGAAAAWPLARCRALCRCAGQLRPGQGVHSARR